MIYFGSEKPVVGFQIGSKKVEKLEANQFFSALIYKLSPSRSSLYNLICNYDLDIKSRKD